MSHFTPGCMFVFPSRCTVSIQNSLFVDWFGMTVLKVVAAFVVEDALVAFALAFVAKLFSANVFCRVWPLIPVTKELADIAATMATAISHVCFDFGFL